MFALRASRVVRRHVSSAPEHRPRTAERSLLARPTLLAVAELLGQLGEMPSTPSEIAAEAHERAAELVSRLPRPEHHFSAGSREHANVAVEVEHTVAVRVASLLELLSEMPSTPPGVTDSAEIYAALLWSLVPGASDAQA